MNCGGAPLCTSQPGSHLPTLFTRYADLRGRGASIRGLPRLCVCVCVCGCLCEIIFVCPQAHCPKTVLFSHLLGAGSIQWGGGGRSLRLVAGAPVCCKLDQQFGRWHRGRHRVMVLWRFGQGFRHPTRSHMISHLPALTPTPHTPPPMPMDPPCQAPPLSKEETWPPLLTPPPQKKKHAPPPEIFSPNRSQIAFFCQVS